MRQRWLSRRALTLHAALLIWSPGCLYAGWWQVTRALGGNGLSYLYSIEWPVFALVGIWAWWALIHTDPATVGRQAQERMQAASSGVLFNDASASRNLEPDDPALAAYNEHLAELAARGPQTWRNR